MICKFCGNVIEDNSDYCFICGQKVVSEAPAYAAEIYSQQPQGAPAQPVYSVAPEQPVYAAPSQPVYAPPVVPAAAESKKCKLCKKFKKADKVKKEKAPVDPAALSIKEKVIIGLLAAIFLAVAGIMCKNLIVVAICVVLEAVVAGLFYKKYKATIDAGYEEKATDMLNTGMIGLCAGMAVVVASLLFNFVIK